MLHVGGGMQLPRAHLSSKCVSTLIITGLGKALVHLKLCSVTSVLTSHRNTNNNTPTYTQVFFQPSTTLIHPHKTSPQTSGSLVPVLKLDQRLEVTCKIMHFCPEINIQPRRFPELVALHTIFPHWANHLKSCHDYRDNYFNGQMTQHAHSSRVLMHFDTKMQSVKEGQS